ncbi:hypothetical protein [Actinopolyspora halophila]|uniref:hypothetical protein n=1 Tax=Actinopolyspora halophila TaxID=1850 RepID=UPI00037DB0AD|nr:hypothetical protein [Actinopolyspora halophila]
MYRTADNGTITDLPGYRVITVLIRLHGITEESDPVEMSLPVAGEAEERLQQIARSTAALAEEITGQKPLVARWGSHSDTAGLVVRDYPAFEDTGHVSANAYVVAEYAATEQ